MFHLRSFTSFPVPYYEPYTSKNLAASIVSPVGIDWSLVIKSSTAKSCRNLTTNGRRATKRVAFQGPCECWTCMGCAMQKVVYHLGHHHKLMSQRSDMWVGELQLNSTLRRTINKSFERRSDMEDRSVRVSYSVIKRPDTGVAYVYATGVPTGGLALCGGFMDSIDAFAHLRDIALRLPGLDRVPSYSRGARPPKKVSNPTNMVVTAPALNAVLQANYLDHLEDMAANIHGVSAEELVSLMPHEFDKLSSQAYQLRGLPPI